jgi:hypothetical protein
MKRIFAILALLGAVGIGAPAWAAETPAGLNATSTLRMTLAQAPSATAEVAAATASGH